MKSWKSVLQVHSGLVLVFYESLESVIDMGIHQASLPSVTEPLHHSRTPCPSKALMIEAFQWVSPADANKKTMPIDTKYRHLSNLFRGNSWRQAKNLCHEPNRTKLPHQELPVVGKK